MHRYVELTVRTAAPTAVGTSTAVHYGVQSAIWADVRMHSMHARAAAASHSRARGPARARSCTISAQIADCTPIPVPGYCYSDSYT